MELGRCLLLFTDETTMVSEFKPILLQVASCEDEELGPGDTRAGRVGGQISEALTRKSLGTLEITW